LRANPTAAAQGALAIEIKRDRADLQALLAPINCAETMTMVNRERELCKLMVAVAIRRLV
jgi:hydroxymethylbilane synthase